MSDLDLFDVVVYKRGNITEVAEIRKPKDMTEAITMMLNPNQRFKRLMGITDDVMAIQYALDCAGKKGRKIVKVDKGRYVIDKTIVLEGGINFIGATPPDEEDKS